MKALITLLLVSIQLAVSANAAECKYQQVEVDPFTKKAPFVATDRYRLTNWLGGIIKRELGNNSEFQVSAVRDKDRDYLALKVRMRRSTTNEPSGEDIREGLVVPEGAKLLILMADDSVTTLYADQTVTASTQYEHDGSKYVIDTSGEIRYRLDASTAEALTRQDASIARFVATGGRLGFVNSGGYVGFELAKKSRGFFKEAILCLQAHGTVDER